MALAALSTVVIAFETEAEAKARLETFGYAPEIAGEIAVYLAQSTDLPQFAGEIAEALGAGAIEARFVPLGELSLALGRTRADDAMRRWSGR